MGRQAIARDKFNFYLFCFYLIIIYRIVAYWLKVLFLYPFRMFSTQLPHDVLPTHVKCLFSAQNPPGSSRDSQYKLTSYSLPGLRDLALSVTTLLILLFSLSGLLTVPPQAGQTPTRGPLHLQFLCLWCSAWIMSLSFTEGLFLNITSLRLFLAAV